MGPPELTTQDHHQPNDHRAWSPLPVQPLVGPRRQPAQDPPARGLVSTCSFSCSPANRPAPWRWTSSLVGKAAGRRRSLCACDAAAQVRRPSCEPPTANAAPPLPLKPVCGRATTPPADHGGTSNPLRPTGTARRTEPFQGQRGADSAAAALRTPEARPSGHLDGTGRVDTAWTPDVSLTDWTDVRTVDRGRGQGDDRRGRRPDILATGDHPLGGQTSPGSQCLGALGHP
jgi:hypothetical protein